MNKNENEDDLVVCGNPYAPKTDPLEDVAKKMGYYNTAALDWADELRTALEARGLTITTLEKD